MNIPALLTLTFLLTLLTNTHTIPTTRYGPPEPTPITLSLETLRQESSSCSNTDTLCLALAMHKIHNSLRASEGASAQPFNCRLYQLSLQYSEKLVQMPVLEHNPKSYMRTHGIYGENIASGMDSRVIEGGMVPATLMDQWWTSPGHKENIMKDNESAGMAGIIRGDNWYGTQMFGPMEDGDDSCAKSGSDGEEKPTVEDKTPGTEEKPVVGGESPMGSDVSGGEEKPMMDGKPMGSEEMPVGDDMPMEGEKPMMDDKPMEEPVTSDKEPEMPTGEEESMEKPVTSAQEPEMPTEPVSNDTDGQVEDTKDTKEGVVKLCFNELPFCLKMTRETAMKVKKEVGAYGVAKRS